MSDDRILRQIRQEARELQEEIEASVADFAASDRTLREALIDYAKLGHEMRIELAGRVLVGYVEHVGAQIVRLVTNEGQRVDVVLDAVAGIRVAGDALRPGTVTSGHPSTLLARLREAVQTQERLHLERRSGEALEGQVIAVLDVAIQLRAGSVTWLLPMAEICYLWRA